MRINSIAFTLLILISSFAIGQNNSTQLLKVNRVSSIKTYATPLKQNWKKKRNSKRTLISEDLFDSLGTKIRRKEYYDNRENLYIYDSSGNFNKAISISNGDTTEAVLTGDLPDPYYHSSSYYINGLVKSDKISLTLYEYEYEFSK